MWRWFISLGCQPVDRVTEQCLAAGFRRGNLACEKVAAVASVRFLSSSERTFVIQVQADAGDTDLRQRSLDTRHNNVISDVYQDGVRG